MGSKNFTIKLAATLLLAWIPMGFATCVAQNYCNGHGICNQVTSTCECFAGWGAPSDFAVYRSLDCSLRTCPAGKAWGDIPKSNTEAHKLVECSNRGFCNRETGVCDCVPGFGGPACNRMRCPNDCSGHGTCFSMRDMAKLDHALPLGVNTKYGIVATDENWDYDVIHGCVCDSSWEVGLGDGQTQEPEWFGADCSQRHCPSADDPTTTAIETNCEGVLAKGGTSPGSLGLEGNLCQVDCANRGLCNFKTGSCTCFAGVQGSDCGDPIYDF